MTLMRLTPTYKSPYQWLAILAYWVLVMVFGAMFGWPVGGASMFISIPCMMVWWWLHCLAGDAQLEADWELPKTPRIDINE